IRVFRIPMVTVSDHERIKLLHMIDPLGVLIFDAPFAGGQANDLLDDMVEANALKDTKNSGVGFKISPKLPVAGIVRIFIRHRKIFVLRPHLRTDDVGVLVDARMASFVVEYPIAADLAALFEDDDVEAKENAILSRDNAAGARTDNANALVRSHDLSPIA